MAYNNGFPMNYSYYQQPMMQQPQMQMQQQQMVQQPMQQQMAQQMQQPVQQQYPVVQGGFVRVRNENEARMFPVAPGNSVTFIDEVQPYCYTKTVNMGQLDRPIFEKYRLVKEEDNPTPTQSIENTSIKQPEIVPLPDLSIYATKQDIADFRSEIETLRGDIDAFRGDLYGIAGKKKTTPKKEVVTDE